MAEKYLVHIEAERFIHNELGSTAHHLMNLVKSKEANDDREGVMLLMMACLVFFAFEIEAQVNFVGWKLFEDDWKERSGAKKKIDRVCNKLCISNDWSQRPLSTILKLKQLRDTLAHGKPDVVNEEFVTDVQPEVWDALKSQWESTVTSEFVSIANEDVTAFWNNMLKQADIDISETITSGGHSFSSLK